MRLNPKTNLLLCLVIALGIIVYTKTSSAKDALIIISGVMGLLLLARRYLWAFKDMKHHVATQARAKNKTVSVMWLEMLKKSFLYIILPGVVLATILLLAGFMFQR